MSTPPPVPPVVRTSVTLSLSVSASFSGADLVQSFQNLLVTIGSDGNSPVGAEENGQNRQLQNRFHNEPQHNANEHYDLSKFGVKKRGAEVTFPEVDYFMNVIENYSEDMDISEWESKASEIYQALDYAVSADDKKLTLRDVISIWHERCENNQVLKEDAEYSLKLALKNVTLLKQ